MDPFSLSFLVFFLFGSHGAVAETLAHRPCGQPASGKAYYKVSASANMDHSLVKKTASFVLATVGSNAFKPSVKALADNLSWIVEADDTQAAQLRNHIGISRLTRIDLSATSAAAEQEDMQGWIVWPADNGNSAVLTQTAEFLRHLTGNEPFPHHNFEGTIFQSWTVNMTDSQSVEASANAGILSIGINYRLTMDMVVPPTSSQPGPRAKRDITFATQMHAPTELASVSQPRYVADPRMKERVCTDNGFSIVLSQTPPRLRTTSMRVIMAQEVGFTTLNRALPSVTSQR